MEIDLEILDMLIANASAKTERWSARVGYEYDSATALFTQSSGESNAYVKGTWFQTLGNKIQAVSNANPSENPKRWCKLLSCFTRKQQLS